MTIWSTGAAGSELSLVMWNSELPAAGHCRVPFKFAKRGWKVISPCKCHVIYKLHWIFVGFLWSSQRCQLRQVHFMVLSPLSHFGSPKLCIVEPKQIETTEVANQISYGFIFWVNGSLQLMHFWNKKHRVRNWANLLIMCLLSTVYKYVRAYDITWDF